MEIKIYYPKRTPEANWENDWDVKVNYKHQYPTLADIENDYKQLPVSPEYWAILELNDDKDFVLDKIFSLFNHYSTNPMSREEAQQWIRNNNVSHTSMSIGDVVALDDEYYVCDTEGWTKITEED